VGVSWREGEGGVEKHLLLCDIWGFNLLTYLLTYLLTHSLTHSMAQDTTWKADRHSARQRTSRLPYGTRKFITVFTKARHWTLSWASWIQFAPSIPISLRSTPMSSSHPRPGLPSGLLPSCLPTKTHMRFSRRWKVKATPSGLRRQIKGFSTKCNGKRTHC